jgi:hypothetical protein
MCMLMTEHGPILVETSRVLVIFAWYINFDFLQYIEEN